MKPSIFPASRMGSLKLAVHLDRLSNTILIRVLFGPSVRPSFLDRPCQFQGILTLVYFSQCSVLASSSDRNGAVQPKLNGPESARRWIKSRSKAMEWKRRANVFNGSSVEGLSPLILRSAVDLRIN